MSVRPHGPQTGLPALVAAFLALSFGLSCAGAAPSAVRTRIMPLGDSITDGYETPGGYRIDLWRALKAKGYDVDFVGSLRNGPASLPDKDHEGHSGWRIDQIRSFIDRWLRTYRPDAILLLIGTNDILQHHRVRGAPARLAALVDRIHADRPRAKLIVSTIPPTKHAFLGRQVRTYNAAILQLVRARAATGRRIWLAAGGGSVTTDDLADNVHPNRVGYSKLAAAWQAALMRAFKSRKGASLSSSALALRGRSFLGDGDLANGISP
jgi:lysophospholipase L1-like esterase